MVTVAAGAAILTARLQELNAAQQLEGALATKNAATYQSTLGAMMDAELVDLTRFLLEAELLGLHEACIMRLAQQHISGAPEPVALTLSMQEILLLRVPSQLHARARAPLQILQLLLAHPPQR